VNIFSRNSRLCSLGLNNCTTYGCWQENWGLVSFLGNCFLLAFANYSTTPIYNRKGIQFSFGRLVFISEMDFHSTMKGNLITGPGVTAHSDHVKPNVIIKTWFPEIPRENVQQIIGVHHNFHIT